MRKPRTYTSAEVKDLYKMEGRVPYEVEQAISKYDTWVERTVNPNKIDSHIDAYTFKGKTEKPRFDRLVKELKAGRDTNPILIEGTINPLHAHQVKGATFEEPIDGYARLAAHKKLNKPIKILTPMKKKGAWASQDKPEVLFQDEIEESTLHNFTPEEKKVWERWAHDSMGLQKLAEIMERNEGFQDDLKVNLQRMKFPEEITVYHGETKGRKPNKYANVTTNEGLARNFWMTHLMDDDKDWVTHAYKVKRDDIIGFGSPEESEFIVETTKLKPISRDVEGEWAQRIVYHGKWSNTETGKDFGGKHFGTKQAAKDRLGDVLQSNAQEIEKSRRRLGKSANQYMYDEAKEKLGKPVIGKYVFDDEQILGTDVPLAEGMYTPDNKGNLRDMVVMIAGLPSAKKKIQDEGYKGVAYINEVEHPGSVSYLIFDDSIVKQTRKPRVVSLPLARIHRRKEVRKPRLAPHSPSIWNESIKVGKVK